MRRREFITFLGGIVSWPIAAHAQQPTLPVVGILAAPAPPYAENVKAVHQGLNEAGYVEGHNVTFEYRWAGGQYDRLPALAAELVERRVAVLVTMGGAAPAMAAKAATSAIPIVFHVGGDPVQFGIVPSFNRPGGNITGVSFLTVELAAKRMELLHELVPNARLIGLLTNPSNPNAEIVSKNLRAAVSPLGLQLYVAHAKTKRDIDAAFASFARQRVEAILVDADVFFLTEGGHIATLAARQSLPAIYANGPYAKAGGLMSYGASIADAYRLAGNYVGRILKGARPADLPVMQSTKFELAINLRTAKALKLEIPPKMLALADEVIE